MFTEKKKLVLIIIIIFVMSFSSVVLYADCDMMAMIAKKEHRISWISGNESPSYFLPDDPHDYFKFLYELSPNNPDGYGIIYMDSDGNIPEIDYPVIIGSPTQLCDVSEQAWYVITDDTASNDYTIGDYPVPYEDAKSKILESSNEVGVVLGHVRNATGETYGSHPFQIICDTNGDDVDETYMFMHNGNVTDMVSTFRTEILGIDNDWFDANPSNYEGSSTGTTGWIDSEMYLHYLMAHVKDADGNFMKGIYNALSNVSADYQTGISINEGLLDNNVNANFVLTDGENLYLYRNCDSNNYRLAYDEHDNGFFGVQTSNSFSQFTLMQQNSFVIISQYGDPVVMNDFLMDDDYHLDPAYIVEKTDYSYNFVSGEIDNNTTDLNIHYRNTYISGDTYINSGNTLDLDSEIVGASTFFPEIKFAGHQNLFIEGTLNVNEGASLNLSNSSLVEISDSGFLFLDWGSTITGCTQTTYGATPPGQPVGGERQVLGDRIIAKNGGLITTDIPDELQPGDPVVTISSSSGELWVGISIQNPSDEADYWFVNCNIEEIGKLSMENVGLSARNIARLNLYQTDFHDNNTLLVRGGHELTIDDCDITNNAGGILVYDSPATIENSTITGNGTGVYMNYACDYPSVIYNCEINNNDGNGLVFRDRDIEFRQNNVQNNLYNGIVAYSVGIFAPFEDNDISNNEYTEYGGFDVSYTWANNNNTIADLGYTNSSDRYILKVFGWVQGDDQVDVSGNNIYHGDIERFWPTIDAFYFGGIVSDEKMMFDSASEDMNAGNYAAARSTFEQIVTDYPVSIEAAASLQKIYFIENYTDQNYDDLLLYIENISTVEGSTMHRVKRDLITKTYMQKEEYNTAINLLETVIANPANDIILTDALIDQAYCYVKLVEEGSRALPEICTFKPQDFSEFLQIVNELENSLYEKEEPLEEEIIPVNVTLSNYPNPFNPTTTISFSLPEDGNVELSIYNVKGQKVKTLTNEFLVKGLHSIEWNGKDTNNKSVSSGIYFYKISADKETAMKKMLLLK